MNQNNLEKIIEKGIVFHKNSTDAGQQSNGKASKRKNGKKRYVNGAHGSGSAKMKAEYRRRRAVKSAKKSDRHGK